MKTPLRRSGSLLTMAHRHQRHQPNVSSRTIPGQSMANTELSLMPRMRVYASPGRHCFWFLACVIGNLPDLLAKATIGRPAKRMTN